MHGVLVKPVQEEERGKSSAGCGAIVESQLGLGEQVSPVVLEKARKHPEVCFDLLVTPFLSSVGFWVEGCRQPARDSQLSADFSPENARKLGTAVGHNSGGESVVSYDVDDEGLGHGWCRDFREQNEDLRF